MQPQIFIFSRSSQWAREGPNRFELDGSRLRFDWHPLHDQFVVPSEDQWRQLEQTCSAIDVWSFPEDCKKPWICDGALYELEIKWAGKYVRSEGQLCDEPKSFSQRVMTLNAAICALIPSDLKNVVDLERQRISKANREAAKRAAPINAKTIKRHNRENAAYWRHLSAQGFECINCKGRVFLLNGYPGQKSLVICDGCGWSYPRPEQRDVRRESEQWQEGREG